MEYNDRPADSRIEFLIAIEYLLNNCYNEKTAAKRKDVVEYAKDTYDVEIRPDRVPHIYMHLNELCEKYPNKFPFKIGTKNTTGGRVKYYIKERQFSFDQVEDIIVAIRDCVFLKKDYKEQLINRFIDVNVPKQIRNELLTNVNKKVEDYDVQMINKDVYKVLEIARKDKLLIRYKIKYPKGVYPYDSFKGAGTISRTGSGYVYKLFIYNNTMYACIYESIEKTAYIIDALNIDFTSKPISMDGDEKKVSFQLRENLRTKEQLTIDDFIDGFIKKKLGRKVHFVCSYTNPLESGINMFIEDYIKYWNEKPKGKKSTIASNRFVSKKEYELVFEINCSIEEFMAWYLRSPIMNKVKVISPEGYGEEMIVNHIEHCLMNLHKHYNNDEYTLHREQKLSEDEQKSLEKWFNS